MATTESIRARVQAALPDANITVRDSTGQGDHFALAVVSPSFRGQGLVDRHRAIYAALGAAMQSEIHALALDTLTPEEYSARAGRQDQSHDPNHPSKKTRETP